MDGVPTFQKQVAGGFLKFVAKLVPSTIFSPSLLNLIRRPNFILH
jgi:hypothetical protein